MFLTITLELSLNFWYVIPETIPMNVCYTCKSPWLLKDN